MVEKVDTRPRIHYDNGKWRTHSNLFKPPRDRTEKSVETDFHHLPAFTANDLFYLGFLMVSHQSIDLLQSLRSSLDPQSRRQIASYLNGLNSVNLEDYFEPKREKYKIEAKVKWFANLNLEARQVFMAENPQAAKVLAPISHLAKDEMIFWHHIIHNDHASMH